MKFLQVSNLENARAKLLDVASAWLPVQRVLPISFASGEVLASDMYSSEDVPHFRRSTVDGYAVMSKDTAAAGESLPSFLKVVGNIEMGFSADFAISSGECAEIPTGGMLPDGADAVVMVEYCETFGKEEVAVYKSAAFGSNVVQVGDDCKSGNLLLPIGRRLTPLDIGILATAGIKEVPVFAPPSICFISTGDELVSHDCSQLVAGRIRESNNLTLSVLAAKLGFSVLNTVILPDDEMAIKKAALEAMDSCDIVAISGGSSQGKKDLTAAIIDGIARPGVFIHGIAIKPGKPTILGSDGKSKTILAGLPGHPISAVTVFELLFGWIWKRLTKSHEGFPIPAKLTQSAPGSEGRLTVYPCKLGFENGTYMAEPIFAKSGLLANLTAAHGYFLIDRNTEGLKKGADVLVWLFYYDTS